MLYISYGLQKSASTFCFQLMVDIAEAAGHSQQRLRESFLPRGQGGFLQLQTMDLGALATCIPAEEIMIVKTHSPMSQVVRDLINRGLVKASATYRDPRDAAVALLDAGEKDRQRNVNRAFSDVHTMREAIDMIAGNLHNLASWLKDPRVLKVSFNLLSQEPEIAVRQLAEHLGAPVDAATIIAPYRRGDKAIGEFNRGEAGRYRQAMSAADLAYADERFESHMERMAQLGLEMRCRLLG